MALSRREFLRAAATSVVLQTGLGTWPNRTAGQASTVRIGTAVIADYALAGPVIIAAEKGFFKEAGVNVEFVPFRGGPPLLKAVTTGEILIGISGSTDILVGRHAGVPIRMIASTTDGNHFTLNVAPGITNAGDLRGKSIGVTAVGAATWVLARAFAKREGWDPDRDVKIVALGAADAQLAAVIRGEIQAFVWGDGGAVFEVEGKTRVLLRFDTVTPKWISQIAYATEDSIKRHPDAIRRSLQGIFRAIRFMKENSDEAARIASQAIGWPVAAVKRAHQNSAPLLPPDGRFSVEALKVMQDTLFEQGLLKRRLPLEEHYTTDFVPVRG